LNVFSAAAQGVGTQFVIQTVPETQKLIELLSFCVAGNRRPVLKIENKPGDDVGNIVRIPIAVHVRFAETKRRVEKYFAEESGVAD